MSILKNSQQSQPTESLKPKVESQPDTGYSPGPGQNITAPKRGKGELCQQQPGMRTPVCGACDGQIRWFFAECWVVVH